MNAARGVAATPGLRHLRPRLHEPTAAGVGLPAPPTRDPTIPRREPMLVTLRRERLDGATDLVIEQRRSERTITDRLDLDFNAHRVELAHGNAGIVLYARQSASAPATKAEHHMLAVGLIPAFGDNRPLPPWPITWTPDGHSVHVGIECPDDTELVIHTGPRARGDLGTGMGTEPCGPNPRSPVPGRTPTHVRPGPPRHHRTSASRRRHPNIVRIKTDRATMPTRPSPHLATHHQVSDGSPRRRTVSSGTATSRSPHGRRQPDQELD